MIQVRNVYHLKFGQSHAAVALLKELAAKFPDMSGMILSDLSGRDFTVVLETEYDSLSAWEEFRRKAYANDKLMDLGRQFGELLEASYTELYTVEHRQG